MKLFSSNPTISAEKYERSIQGNTGETMTVSGAVNKTLLLFLFLLIPAIFAWNTYDFSNPELNQGISPLLMIGGIGGFILALVTIFAPKISGITAPLYAIFEGLFLGAFSGYVELMIPGIASQAIFLTFGVLFIMLGLYKGKLIVPTKKFRTGIMAATGAIALVYLISIVAGFFGASIPLIHEGGPVGIIFSLVVIAIAAFNLIIDFDNIQQGENYGAPKYMEWYSAFGLMLTLVWLYLEIIRLLMKLANRD